MRVSVEREREKKRRVPPGARGRALKKKKKKKKLLNLSPLFRLLLRWLPLPRRYRL